MNEYKESRRQSIDLLPKTMIKRKREGLKIFGAAFSHFGLTNELDNWFTHHTCKQNVTIYLSLPFDCLYFGILAFVLTFNQGSRGKK